MPDRPTHSRPKRTQRLKGDPLADLDQLIADAASTTAETAGQPPAPPPAEEPSPDRAEAGAVCPYLGMEGEPANHMPAPSQEHRCYGAHPPREIFPAHQLIYCLTAEHPSCEMYVWVKATEAGHSSTQEPPKGGWLARVFGRK